ncbi:uncharacterized protein LOC131689931 isoform X2 [Topomyia yanbarensis]|uniref:uncharacterized protein LOC131689931 isoform X2 n=1 Tax=Topomyia yanbarensis TaxID=2498891 RepID=UPI00273C7CC8|nr:uncharacterized protein LOC131689931 isoform X2 [Topomyia yanbarensis]
MERFVVYVLCLSVLTTHADVFATKSLIRALVPPRRDNEYGNTQPTTTLLPEVIINRKAVSPTIAPQQDSQGYLYDPFIDDYLPPDKTFADEPVPLPQLPPFSDGYPSVVNQYIPPDKNPVFSDKPANDYLPPLQQPPQSDEIIIVTTAPGYLYEPPSSSQPSFADEGFVNPPSIEDGYHYNTPTNGYLPPVGRSLRDEIQQGVPIRLQLNELACQQNSGGYFRSTLTIQNFIDSTPIVDVDSDSGDLLPCNVRIDQSRLLVNIDASYFTKCGVQRCGSNARELCLRLRFPQIVGMRTASDAILTLQCKIQQRVVARTHAFRLGIGNNVQGKSASGTFAFGGSQRPFRSQLGLFRKQDNGNGFTRSLEPGGSVLLGEDLILRTQVKSGDGWNYTRLSEVVMQRLSHTREVLNSATLVTLKGFRLAFRAAMFQGMRSGDEMVLRVRVVGCVDRRECSVESCATVRSKRETTENFTTEPVEHELPSEIATISFRILLPANATVGRYPSGVPTSVLTLWTTVIISLITLIALIVLIGIIKLYRTKQPCYDEYRSD